MTGRTGKIVFVLALIAVGAAVVGWLLLRPGPEKIDNYREAKRPANIYPDYSGVTIPPNIAPLNFQIREPKADRFCLRISGDRGKAIEVFSDDGIMPIEAEPWSRLLEANTGGEIRMDIFARMPGKPAWAHFDTIRNRIAAERIDPYVVYRMMPPICNFWQDLTIRQRSLAGFDERIVYDNRRSVGPDGKSSNCACINCHTFFDHHADTMLLHARPGGDKSQGPSMIVIKDGKATKIDTRNGNEPPAAYVSWHPSGKLVAFSRNSLWQMFHTAGPENREVVDRDSDLGIYRLDTGEAAAPAPIAQPGRLETFPCWSPDGKYLYFCSAPLMWEDKKRPAMDLYQKVRYDLMRVPYDESTRRWGEPETVVSAGDLGKSISEPRISPDGRFLMFCGHDYGSFPIYQPSSDLYMIDLSGLPATTSPASSPASSSPAGGSLAKARRLDVVNSDLCDSYHSWSANGRWVIFTSKREDGLYARLYITHVDADGNCTKPFMLPQRDSTSNSRLLLTYNLPEFLSSEVLFEGGEITRAINSTASRPATATTPKRSASPTGDEPWQAPN